VRPAAQVLPAFLAGGRVDAQSALPGIVCGACTVRLGTVRGEGPCELALGIIRAADEGAEFAELERKLAEVDQIKARAASISTAMSASLNAMAWLSMIGRPNCLRCLA